MKRRRERFFVESTDVGEQLTFIAPVVKPIAAKPATKKRRPPAASKAQTRRDRAMSAVRRLACMLGEFHDVNPDDILARRGRGQPRSGAEIHYILHELIYLGRRLKIPQKAMADAVGRHHSTAQNSIKFAEYLKESPEAFAALQWLEQRARENFEKGEAYRAALEGAREEARRVKKRERV